MNRIIAIFVMIFLILVPGCASVREANSALNQSQAVDVIKTYRDIPGVTEEEIDAIEALKSDSGFFTYASLLETDAFQLPDGTYKRFANEFYSLLSELFGIEFRPVYCEEWEDFSDAVKNCEINFAGAYMPSPELLDVFIKSEPIAGRALHVYMLAGNDNIKSESDIGGHRIAFLSKTATSGLIAERYPGLSFEVIEVSRFSEAFELLKSGEADALVADSATDPKMQAYGAFQFIEMFSLVNKSVRVSTADPRFAPVISVFNKYLSAGGEDKIYEIYTEGEHDYNRYKLFASFTEEEKAYITERTASGMKVDVGMQHDAYPVSFYNHNDNEYQGVAIDIFGEITKLTGLEFDHITTSTDTPISEILEKLKAGEISMMTQLLYAESRKNDYLWSDAYLETNYALLSKSELPDLDIYQVYTKKVGTVAKTAHEEMFEAWFPEHQHQIVYATTDNAFTALEEGEIDLLMLSENMLLTQTNYREKPGFKINIDFYVPLESYYGLSKNEETLRSIVNKSMEHINLGKIGSNWLNRNFDYTKKIHEMQSRYLSLFSAAMLVVLFAILFLFIKNRRLGMRLAERTATLSTILSSIPDIVYCKNSDGLYTSCNSSFEEWSGKPESEVIGKTYREVFRDRINKAADVYEELDKRILSEGKQEIYEEVIEYPDGTRSLLETNKAPLIQNGKIVGILGISRDVTERKEIKTRLDRIINAAQIIFVMSIDNIVIEANEFVKNYIGIKIGDDIRSFYINPEHRRDILKRTDTHGSASNVSVMIKIRDGSVHRFLASYTQTEYEQKTAYIMWAIDIERDEQMNDQLQAAQETLNIIMNTLPIPVCIAKTETNELLYINKMFADIMGYDSIDEAIKINSIDIFTDEQRDGENANDLHEYFANITEPVIKESILNSQRNANIDVRIHAAPIDYYGNKAVIGLISDLTHEKETQRVLIAAAEREKEANQSKSLFLANMSHEIRTPMNGIIGMTDLLLGEDLSVRQLQYAKDIKTSADSLLSIINDILDLSKISEGKLSITPVDVELSLLLKNTVSMISFSAKSKGLRFIDDISISSPEFVKIDDVRLKQILVNLLSNAVKFTKKGYVKLSVKIEDGCILFVVSDTGIGIKNENIPIVFEVFGQVDRQKNRFIKGTGLGLSISKNLTELMGGKIWVESEYGKGTSFYVSLPYVKGDEDLVEKEENEFEYISAPTAQILLVDDIQSNLTVAAGLLRLCDITADVTLTGHEAIELVKDKDYDIVFMDHMMPEMDGIDAMNIIKSKGGKYKKMPIIALTANAVNESKDFLLSSGMDDFLSKPIDKRELMNILRKWLPEEKIEKSTGVANKKSNIDYSETLMMASEIEGLDVELALSRINGLQDVLEATIKQVAHSIKSKLKNMDIYLSGDNLKGFSIEAHGLKGALANIGATDNSELAAELEIASKANNKPLCLSKFAVFADKLSVFADKLTAIFLLSEAADKPIGDNEYFKLKTDEAINYLDNFESSDAGNCLKELVKYSFGPEEDLLIKDAAAALEAFDYDKSALLLKEMRSLV